MAADIFYRVSVSAGATGGAPGSASTAYDLSEDISSLKVEQAETRPDSARIELADEFKVLGSALQEGMNIEIDLGDDTRHSVIFRGRIYKIAQDFPKDGVPKLSIQAYDELMKLGLRKRSRALKGSLEEVVTAVVRDDNYRFGRVDISVASKPKFGVNGIRQQDWTDLEFLRRLARMFGCVMYVQPGANSDTFHFVDQLSVMNGAPEVALFYGRCDAGQRLLSFDASVDIADIRLPRALSGTDIQSGKPIAVTTGDQSPARRTKNVFFDENMNEFRTHEPLRAKQLQSLQRAAPDVAAQLRTERGSVQRAAVPTPMSADELLRRAKSQFTVNLQGMTARGTCTGVKELIAGSSVSIQDVGERFNGTWFLSQVTHLLTSQGYTNEFECRR